MVTTAAPASVSRLETLRRTNTPARMRIAAGGTAILAIVMAFVGSTAFAARATTLEDARDSAAQLGQIEAIRTGIVEADALASTSYLRAGLEAPEERARYTALIADAQARIVTTARGGTGSDVTTLGKVSDSLPRTSPSSSSPAPTSARGSRSAPPINARHRAWSATRSSRSSMPSPPAAPNEPPRRSMTTRGRSWDCGSRPSRCSLRSWSDRSGCTGEPDGS